MVRLLRMSPGMSERSNASRTYRLAACFLAALVSACETEVVSLVEVDVEVYPPSITLSEGDRATASAVIRERGGAELSGMSVTWTVDDPAVATVNSEGVVEGRAPGFTLVRASSAGASGSAEVRVSAAPPDCQLLCL